jgi:exopolysaccharide biosynthesis polyprenyl glycosylphosphotransferase
MFKRFGPNYMLLLYLTDLGCSILALSIAQHIPLLPISTRVLAAEAPLPVAIYALVTGLFGGILPLMSLYDARRIIRAVKEAERVVLGVAMSAFVLAGILYLTYRGISRQTFLYFVGIDIALLLAYRAVLRLLPHTSNGGAKAPVVLIAGAGPIGRQVASLLTSSPVRIAGFVDDDPRKLGMNVGGCGVLGGLDAIPAIVQRHAVTDVVFALQRSALDRLATLLVTLWKLPLRVYVIPDFFDLGFGKTQVEYLGGLTVIGLREPVIDGFQSVAKRLIDLVLGSVILVVSLPVMALIAIVIPLDSPGPILFRQERVGENGRLFTIFKFRTMIPDAERNREAVTKYTDTGEIIHKQPDDPRVTHLGRVLRRFSLDELPQLFNVLRGEMSLVGPRPELPWIVARYDPWQYQRLAVPQGMTSPYVLNGRSEVPMHLNTNEDIDYIRGYSVLEDLRILWKSVGAVLRGRGAF